MGHSHNQGEQGAATSGNMITDQQMLEAVMGMTDVINRAAEAYCGQPGQNPLDVFPNPKAPGIHERSAIELKSGPPVDQEAFRSTMLELGAGRLEDYNAESAGLHDGHLVMLEAGTWAKMFTELQMVRFSRVGAGVVVIAATRERELKLAEREEMAKQLGTPIAEIGVTEYDVACQLAARMPSFQAAEGKIPYGYDAKGNVVEGINAADSPFTHIGTYDNQHVPIYMMDISRQYTGQGRESYTQIDDYGKARVLAQMWRWQGGTEMALVTSHLYPSRHIGAIRAARAVPGMRIETLSYGAESIAAIRGLPVSDPTIPQLAGEAFSVAQHAAGLYAELTEA